MMLAEGRLMPMKSMPPCLLVSPAAPGFEDAGAVFGPDDIKAAMNDDRIIGLGK